MGKAQIINVKHLDILFCNSSKMISSTYPSLSEHYLFLQGLCHVLEWGAESPDWRKLNSSWKQDEYNCVTVMLKPNEQF